MSLRESQRNRSKGQLFSGDLVLSGAIFMVVMALGFYQWFTISAELERGETLDDIEQIAVDVAEQLVRVPGVPENRALGAVTAIGLADDDRLLNETKVGQFITLMRTDIEYDGISNYDRNRYLLGGIAQYDFYFVLYDLDGNVVRVSDNGTATQLNLTDYYYLNGILVTEVTETGDYCDGYCVKTWDTTGSVIYRINLSAQEYLLQVKVSDYPCLVQGTDDTVVSTNFVASIDGEVIGNFSGSGDVIWNWGEIYFNNTVAGSHDLEIALLEDCCCSPNLHLYIDEINVVPVVYAQCGNSASNLNVSTMVTIHRTAILEDQIIKMHFTLWEEKI